MTAPTTAGHCSTSLAAPTTCPRASATSGAWSPNEPSPTTRSDTSFASTPTSLTSGFDATDAARTTADPRHEAAIDQRRLLTLARYDPGTDTNAGAGCATHRSTRRCRRPRTGEGRGCGHAAHSRPL